ncbi:transcriptional repressor SdpR [archaeon]|nr:transcriptional repressor SdpR [archaeon]
MGEIFRQDIKRRELLVTDAKRSKAISDPIRTAIIQILSEKEGSIADINEELKKQDINIAPTTVRHHVDILKKAGIIQLTRLVDSRGGVLKYYASKVKVIQHKAPENFDEVLGRAQAEASKDMLGIIRKMLKGHKSEIMQVVKSLKACPYCSDEHFKEYVLVELLNRAIAEVIQKKEFIEMLEVTENEDKTA